MVNFQMLGDTATLEIDVDGRLVRVEVKPRPGEKITKEDAAVLLTSAVPYFPQRIRFPEPFRR